MLAAAFILENRAPMRRFSARACNAETTVMRHLFILLKTGFFPVVFFISCLSLSLAATVDVRSADSGAPDAQQIPAVTVSPQKIFFSSIDGSGPGETLLLDGYVFRPAGKGPFPAIVALHGCSGLFTKQGKLNARFLDWGKRLSGLGYVVLFPDSFTPRGIPEACTRKNRSGFSPHKERVDDTYSALRWLQSQPFVVRDRVALMGWSNGGVTLLSTVDASLKRDAPEDFRAAIAFYPGCTSFLKNQNWRPRIPLTILIGEADDWTPAAACRSLAARSRDADHGTEIFVFPNAYHDFDHPNLPLKKRNGLAFTVRNDGTATIGTNREARAAALELVPKILDRFLVEKEK